MLGFMLIIMFALQANTEFHDPFFDIFNQVYSLSYEVFETGDAVIPEIMIDGKLQLNSDISCSFSDNNTKTCYIFFRTGNVFYITTKYLELFIKMFGCDVLSTVQEVFDGNYYVLSVTSAIVIACQNSTIYSEGQPYPYDFDSAWLSSKVKPLLSLFNFTYDRSVDLDVPDRNEAIRKIFGYAMHTQGRVKL